MVGALAGAGFWFATLLISVEQPAQNGTISIGIPEWFPSADNPRGRELDVYVTFNGCGQPADFHLDVPLFPGDAPGTSIEVFGVSANPNSAHLTGVTTALSRFPSQPGAETEARIRGNRAVVPRRARLDRLLFINGQMDLTSSRDATSCWVLLPSITLNGPGYGTHSYSARLRLLAPPNVAGTFAPGGQLVEGQNRGLALRCGEEGGDEVTNPADYLSFIRECNVQLIFREDNWMSRYRDVLTFALAAVIGALVAILFEPLARRVWD